MTVGVTNRVAAEVKSGLAAGDQVILPTSPSGAAARGRPAAAGATGRRGLS